MIRGVRVVFPRFFLQKILLELAEVKSRAKGHFRARHGSVGGVFVVRKDSRISRSRIVRVLISRVR